MTKEVKDLSKLKNIAHNIAKITNKEEDWRTFRNCRNNYNRGIKNAKNAYFTNRLTIRTKKDKTETDNIIDNNDDTYDKDDDIIIKPELNNNRTMWNTVKNLSNSNKKQPPRIIRFANKIITSIREICNIANVHYIKKN